MIDESILPVCRITIGETTIQSSDYESEYVDVATLELPDTIPEDHDLAFLFAGVSDSAVGTQIGIKGNCCGTESTSGEGKWSDDGGFCTPWINVGEPTKDARNLVVRAHTTEQVRFEKVALAIGATLDEPPSE
jgi:hypothetical protein